MRIGMQKDTQTVAVLGASPKIDRYSNMAINMLKEYRHRVIPIHPVYSEIEGLPVVPNLSSVKEAVDTLTVYVGPRRSRELLDDIVALNPKRAILNPGTGSPELEQRLTDAGIPFEHACTLVLLRTGQF